MRIGLYNLEPHVVNSAMMRVSRHHKDRGDDVSIYDLFNPPGYDVVYAFSIFDYTDKGYVTKDMICGGTGFDLKTRLPPEIERGEYDWTLYPDCVFSVLWFSTGCIRRCPFCVVPEKEGGIRSIQPKNLNPNGEYIQVMDNNFFANPEWRGAIERLHEIGEPCYFHGVDARNLTDDMCGGLLSLRLRGQIHIAWDDPRHDLLPKLKEIVKFIKPYRLMCYVLIGYWSTEEEDLYRVDALEALGIDQFVMPYNKKDPYQRRFARWCNHKAIRKSCSWRDYKG